MYVKEIDQPLVTQIYLELIHQSHIVGDIQYMTFYTYILLYL